MSTWLPCLYAAALIAVASTLGFGLGRWRERKALLRALKPEKWRLQ